MRKKPLAICISMALVPPAQLATSRHGPISPYQSWINRELYYRMLGRDVHRGRALGKTLDFANNYRSFDA